MTHIEEYGYNVFSWTQKHNLHNWIWLFLNFLLQNRVLMAKTPFRGHWNTIFNNLLCIFFNSFLQCCLYAKDFLCRDAVIQLYSSTNRNAHSHNHTSITSTPAATRAQTNCFNWAGVSYLHPSYSVINHHCDMRYWIGIKRQPQTYIYIYILILKK